MELISNKNKEEFKDFKPTYQERKLDICGICQKNIMWVIEFLVS